MSLLQSLKDSLRSETLRSGLNTALTTAGLPTIATAFVAHEDLLANISYTPAFPAVAVQVGDVGAQRLATDNDYKHRVQVTYHLAYAHTSEAASLDHGVKYCDQLRAMVMTKFDTAAASPIATVRRIRYLGCNVEGVRASNDQGVVYRQVSVRFEVEVTGIVTTA